MDQMVSSVGGFVFIDFEDTDNPKIEKLSCQFEDAGYMLCITDTKGSHADLTDDYVSIPAEMNLVAAQFGKNHLREVDEKASCRHFRNCGLPVPTVLFCVLPISTGITGVQPRRQRHCPAMIFRGF